MARTGRFKSSSKGRPAAIAESHPVEQLSRRYGYEQFGKQLGRQLERESAQRTLQVTKAQTKAARYAQTTQRSNVDLRSYARTLQQAAARYASAKQQRAESAILARQSQAANAMQTRRQMLIPGYVGDTTLAARSRALGRIGSTAQQQLLMAKQDYRSAKRSVVRAQRQGERDYQRAASAATATRAIAAYQAAQFTASQLRARRRLTSFS